MVLWRNSVRKRLAGTVSLTPRPQVKELGLGNFDLGDDDFKIKHRVPIPNVRCVDYDARTRCKGSLQGSETLLHIQQRWTLPACAPTPTDAVTPRGITSEPGDFRSWVLGSGQCRCRDCNEHTTLGYDAEGGIREGTGSVQELFIFFFTHFWERRGRRKEWKREEEGWGGRGGMREQRFPSLFHAAGAELLCKTFMILII